VYDLAQGDGMAEDGVQASPHASSVRTELLRIDFPSRTKETEFGLLSGPWIPVIALS
jgi:hypothetical protein